MSQWIYACTAEDHVLVLYWHTYIQTCWCPCGVQRLRNSSSTVTWLLDEVLIARQHPWQGAGGLRNRSIMSSAAVMNPTHATHKPHNSLQYCWSGFIHIWQFRLMVLFRFACRKTQQVIHTQVSHIPTYAYEPLNVRPLVNHCQVWGHIAHYFTIIYTDCNGLSRYHWHVCDLLGIWCN